MNTLRYADRVKERDPQTGRLSAAVAASSRIKKDQADAIARVKLPPRPLTAPAASFRIEREDESSDDEIPPPPSNEELLFRSLDEAPVQEDEEHLSRQEFDFDKLVDSDECHDSLEEALKSYDNISVQEKERNAMKSSKDGPAAAQTLIATHKSIMSKLLQMLQVRANETCVLTSTSIDSLPIIVRFPARDDTGQRHGRKSGQHRRV